MSVTFDLELLHSKSILVARPTFRNWIATRSELEAAAAAFFAALSSGAVRTPIARRYPLRETSRHMRTCRGAVLPVSWCLFPMSTAEAAECYDLAIIGGGVNGCGIARDAAGRGYRTFLCEMNDLGSGTSSASTKLIHGGLRYLEQREFRLVQEALAEREVIWGIAPHIVWPLRFILPHHPGLRPAWLLRLGLFLYDHLGGRKNLPRTRVLDLTRDVAGAPLKASFKRGFEYSDCWVDDARLVVLNARDAADRGATIRPYCRCLSAMRQRDHWELRLEDGNTVRARVLVNAAGPWVAEVLSEVAKENSTARVRLVQGSHIIVPRLYADSRAYIFQNSDGRVFFAIPYENDLTLIGTTDQEYVGDPSDVAISPAEVTYLCAAASDYFRQPVTGESVVWTYSGVRSLYDSGTVRAQDASRDYELSLTVAEGVAPLLSVFGGKITTFRKLAEDALRQLAPYLPTRGGLTEGWTGRHPLPGGDFGRDGFEALTSGIGAEYPSLSPSLLRRLVRAYGTATRDLLGDGKLGREFGAGLTEAELRHLMRREWAVCAEDVLWRRTKLGLRLSTAQREAIDTFMRPETPR